MDYLIVCPICRTYKSHIAAVPGTFRASQVGLENFCSTCLHAVGANMLIGDGPDDMLMRLAASHIGTLLENPLSKNMHRK